MIFCVCPSSPIKLTGLTFNQSFLWKLTRLWTVRPAAGSFHSECVQSRFISYFDNYLMPHERLLSRDERGLRSAGAGRSVKFVGVGGLSACPCCFLKLSCWRRHFSVHGRMVFLSVQFFCSSFSRLSSCHVKRARTCVGVCARLLDVKGGIFFRGIYSYFLS